MNSEEKNKQLKESKILRTIGFVIILLALLSSVLIVILAGFIDGRDGLVFNPICIFYVAVIMLPSLAITALFDVISNISNNITRIAYNKDNQESKKQ